MKYRPGWTHPHRPSTASGLCSGGRSSALRSAQLTFDPPAVAPLVPRTFRFSRSLPQSTDPHARTQILFEWSSTSRSARAIHLQPRPRAPSNTRDLWCQMGKTTSIELVYGEST
uniref:Uncharacterized protein n=1 Tax=Setaria viridis TaxID=4556 RepID=A0A4U6WG12_SETVI|nr:hypothetical protein SEVIR_1G282900v2 [Setaria viridis]